MSKRKIFWRRTACSAAAHGDTWALLSLHDRQVSDRVNDVVTLQTTASTRALTTMVVEAFGVIKSAFVLRDVRNRPPY